MKQKREIKVGLFVIAGLLFTGVVIFLIGDERRLFSSAIEFNTRFANVQGLKSGAPVQMGGIDIGHVADVGYGRDPKDTTVYVTLSIVKGEASRIKTDSLARIATKGLLGDKMIEITKGEAADVVKPHGHIPADESPDMMARVGGMTDKAEMTLKNIEQASKALADENFQRDVRDSVAALRGVLEKVDRGDGYLGRMVGSRDEAERISRTLDQLDRATVELNATLRSVRAVVQRVEQGPGFAHDVLYGPEPPKAVAEIGSAAAEVATTLKGVRESDSFAHDLLYGGKGSGAETMANLVAISADVRAIVGDVRKGKGTVGALLVDPSIYEDMKSVLGNVQRNDVLRALVRYSIKQDEKKPAVDVKTGETQRP